MESNRLSDQAGIVARNVRHVKIRVPGEISFDASTRDGSSNVRRHEWVAGDVAVLACQVSNLAGSRVAVVAWRDFTTHVRVHGWTSRGAVAIGRNRVLVDVVHLVDDVVSMVFEETSVNWPTHRKDPNSLAADRKC